MRPRQEIETIGFTVVPGVLTAAEISGLRRMAIEYFRHAGTRNGLGRYQGAAGSCVSGIEALLCHPGLLAAFRELLGNGQLVFTGSADMHENILNAWHRDSTALGRDAWQGDYFARDSCKVLRAGIYLQDHSADDLGLNVRPGSHKIRDGAAIPSTTVNCRPGDAVFFDARLMHAGVLPNRFENILRGAARRLGEPWWLYLPKEALWRARGRGRRLSLFVGFGLQSPDMEDFCRFDLQLRRQRVGGARCLTPARLRAALGSAGVACYETDLVRRFGQGVLDDFAAGKELPGERLWP